MTKRLLLIAIAVLVVFTTSACQASTGLKPGTEFEPSTLDSMTPPIEESVQSANALGYSLLKSLIKDKNALISPFSLSTALAMVQNGAADDTRLGILNTMGEKDPESINSNYNQLISTLSKTPAKEDEEGLNVLIGNSFWFKKGITPKQTFIDTLATEYGAEVYESDFSSPKPMNLWVEEKTNGLLKETLKEISKDAVAYLMNTVYFKGTWVYDFNVNATFDEPFTLVSGKTKNVAMMHQLGNREYAENADAQVAAFPYNGGMTMKVILPKGDLFVFLEKYDYSALAALLKDTKDNTVRLDISMPKFEYDVQNGLSELLINAGMDMAFDPAKADFKPMIEIANENVYISNIFQNAKIINDEKGTEAAAVTVIEMETTSAPIEEEPTAFHMNRPFFYTIEDDTTGAVLFMGVVLEP